MTSRSLLVINYRSAALALDAIRTARAASSQPLQVVVVDNSLDPREADALRPHVDVLIESQTNRGYAGGINDGRRACDGEVMIVTNPDVTFAACAIDRLVDAVDEGASVAGPALFWDDAHRWFLPPADLHDARERIDAILAARASGWRAQRDRRRFRARVAFWSLTETTDVCTLSGAVLAIRLRDFDRVAGFDERFALYFEETDYLRRIAELQLPIRYVPAARCRHLYNQSAGQVAADAATRYAASELRYLEKWNGPFVARFLKRLERAPRVETLDDAPLIVDRDNVIIEASPLPDFATAAGCFAERGPVQLPPDVRSAFRGGPLYLRAVDRETGTVLARTRAVK